MSLKGSLLYGVTVVIWGSTWVGIKFQLGTVDPMVSVLFSSIVFMNIANGAFFLGAPVERKMVLGAVVGIAGIGLIFMHEIESFDLTDKNLMGVALGFPVFCWPRSAISHLPETPETTFR